MTTIVEVLVLKGGFPSSAAITFDVLATANRLRERQGRPAPFATRAKGSAAKQARAFVGGVDASGSADVIVVPGPGFADEKQLPGRLLEGDVRAAVRTVAAGYASGVEIAGSCSGVFLLAEAGVLEGRRATTTWWLAPLFRSLYPGTDLDADALLVTDGPVMTAGASMAQLDLLLALVARHADGALADECARYLVLDQRRSQSRYMTMAHLTAKDDHVSRAERWVSSRLDEPVRVEDMAAAVSLSARTFARRVERATGLSPIKLLQRLRAERALELVETTRLPFEEIARQVGYSEASTLRSVLKRHVGGGSRSLRAVQA
jgi:transcriptional regulator GlxA family with amidase domain